MKPPAIPPLAERQKPGLSHQLPGPRAPNVCQSCSRGGLERSTGRRYIECDPWDKPTTRRVVLCAVCSDRLIKPHPLLYLAEDWWAPFPGVMPTCAACQFHDALRCTNPLLKANGGPGLRVHPYPGGRGILCGGPGGCRPFVEWLRPPACRGFALAATS